MRLIIGVVMTHGLVLQLLLSSMSGGMHSAAQASGIDGFAALCSGAGATAGTDTDDHHEVGSNCCQWTCATANTSPALANRNPETLVLPGSMAKFSGWPKLSSVSCSPPDVFAAQQARAPPQLS
jgi:hypothetical protein